MSWRGGQDIAWIAAAVIAKVPCGECRQHTRAYLQANPPDFTAAGYLPWTVAFHNAVNARLGRPSWTVEQARAHWAAAPVL
jgi:hypothetical protein